MNFIMRQKGRKSNRDNTMIKLLKSPAIIPSGIPKISDPDDLCNRLKLLFQEKQAANNSDLINKEIIAIVDKMLE